MIERAATKFSNNPKSLLLIDFFGALLSALLLGVVLVQLEVYFGIPKNTLYLLAFLPCLFAVYDILAYLFGENRYPPLLKVIALVNLLYCFLSIILAINHIDSITLLGWGYLIIEILIVGVLAMIEFKTAQKLKQ